MDRLDRVGMEDLMLDAVSGLFAEWWWLIALAIVIAILRKLTFGTHHRRIAGKAYVIDGDSLRVDGQEVRIVGLDAPELGQQAEHQDGRWFDHGQHVKDVLIQEIGGKRVRVSGEDRDAYGRLLGTVTFGGRDIGEWLVRDGHAIADDSDDRYQRVQQEACEAKRGMWAHAHNFDPRAHRHRKQDSG